MSELTRFQDAFCAALGGEADALSPWLADTAAPGLAVYRNTVLKGAVDALASNFPTVQRLVGEAWFRAAAREYALAAPPPEPALLGYGAGFPNWLAAFEPAAGLPYLAPAAGLDRLWSEAHLAPPAAPLQGDAFEGLDEDGLAYTAARLHPAARFAWFARNIPSLWLANRPPAEPDGPFELADRPEGVLVTRPGGEVRARVVDAATFAFLCACRDGESLAVAAMRALAQPGADLGRTVVDCLAAGALASLEPKEPAA